MSGPQSPQCDSNVGIDILKNYSDVLCVLMDYCIRDTRFDTVMHLISVNHCIHAMYGHYKYKYKYFNTTRFRIYMSERYGIINNTQSRQEIQHLIRYPVENLSVNGHQDWIWFERHYTCFLNDKNNDSTITSLRVGNNYIKHFNLIYFTHTLRKLTLESMKALVPRFDDLSLLPDTLTHLTIGMDTSVNHLIKSLNTLPKSLEYLTIERLKCNIDDFAPPKSLKYLYISKSKVVTVTMRYIPSTLKHLSFQKNIIVDIKHGQLPCTLEYLKIPMGIIQHYPNRFPSTLQYYYCDVLIHNQDASQLLRVEHLPQTLIHLRFGLLFNTTFETRYLSRTLQTLVFGRSFNQKIDWAQLPRTLEVLKFGLDFDQHVDANKLPRTLRVLKFGCNFNQALDISQLPSTLKVLEFGTFFNQRIDASRVPQGLEYLAIGWQSYHVFDWFLLPKSVCKIKVCYGDVNLGQFITYVLEWSCHRKDTTASSSSSSPLSPPQQQQQQQKIGQKRPLKDRVLSIKRIKCVDYE